MCYFEAWKIIENSSEKQTNKQTNKQKTVCIGAVNQISVNNTYVSTTLFFDHLSFFVWVIADLEYVSDR